MKITNIHAREILDSKGTPTIEAEVILEDGSAGVSAVPSGASTGSTEALELRDGNKMRYHGNGVLKAMENIKNIIHNELIGFDAHEQKKIDQKLIELDGTENKSNLGGNAILAVSMAICKASALSQKIPLFEYFGLLTNNTKFSLPQPQILIMEGGKHGNWATDIQEYMVIPKNEAFEFFSDRLRVGVEIFYTLGQILEKKDYSKGVGFEGAYMPKELKSNREALELISEAVEKAGYKLNSEVILGIDAAASEFQCDGGYVLNSEHGQVLSPREWSDKIISWSKDFPIWSIEDALGEEDWNEWVYLTHEIGKNAQIIGDDLFTTNVKRIKRGIQLEAANTVLIKPNQIGTISETLDAIKLADQAGWTTVISHRGGETNDDLIADLVVGTTSWQSKFGGPDRGERVAKYNRLLRIEEALTKK